MTKIIMHGCNGKMGQVICGLVKDDPNAEIAAGIDITACNAPFPTYTNINDCDIAADVIIDFSTAKAVPAVIEYALAKKLPAVICTTGLSDETLKMMEDASKVIPVFKSANMSVGINLIASLLKKYSDVLYENGFDIEMLDAVCKAVSVPVIASGGAGCIEDFIELFRRIPDIDAGLAASIFHFGEVSISDLKDRMAEEGIPVRR